MSQATQDVGSRLLAYLRSEWDVPSLDYLEPPERIVGGNATFIYGFELAGAPKGFEGELVLRLFRADQGADWVRVEATIQDHVAGLGFPAPRVSLVCTDTAVLDAPFLLMERVRGTNLFSSIAPTSGDAMHVDLARLAVSLPRSVLGLPRTIAEWLCRLHGLDPLPLLDGLRDQGIAPEVFGLEREREKIDATLRDSPGTTRSAFAAALGWIDDRLVTDREQIAICHGDFHPLNVMAQDGNVTGVIDWTDACLAPPAYDVAQSRFLFRFGPLSLPRLLRPLAGAGQQLLARAFLSEYRRRCDADLSSVDDYEAIRILRELVAVARERLIETGAHPGAPRPSGNPWDRCGRVPSLVRRFEEISGVVVSLPTPG